MPRSLPIPPLHDGTDWPEIVECGEPLVVLSGPRILCRSVYSELGLTDAEPTVRLREGVCARLNRAASTLPEGLGFVVYDGFRPYAVQQALWDWQWHEVQTAHPTLSDTEIDAIVQHFVARPTLDTSRPTPHRTGGAVDLTLVDLATTIPLPMGTAFDEATDESATRWFEDRPLSPFTENRRLLFHTLHAEGFANYANEWWHYEYGTRRHAGVYGMNLAVYGSAE